jgi:hypothetical protein
MHARDMERITVYVPPGIKRAVRLLAVEDSCSAATVGRRAIEAYLAARANGAANPPADHAAPTGDAGRQPARGGAGRVRPSGAR